MILDALGRLVLAILEPLINVLPKGTLPLPSVDRFGSLLNHWDYLLPVKGPLAAVALWAAALAAYLAFRAALWVWRLLPMT